MRPLQERYEQLRQDPGELDRVLSVGANTANEAANETLERARDALGLLPPFRGSRSTSGPASASSYGATLASSSGLAHRPALVAAAKVAIVPMAATRAVVAGPSQDSAAVAAVGVATSFLAAAAGSRSIVKHTGAAFGKLMAAAPLMSAVKALQVSGAASTTTAVLVIMMTTGYDDFWGSDV